MARSCCAKPIARIIEIADFEAGIIGLEETFWNVDAMGLEDETRLKAELLSVIREFGNYVSRTSESEYKEALLREYKKFQAARKSNAGPSPTGG
jgi:hypothetical protein